MKNLFFVSSGRVGNFNIRSWGYNGYLGESMRITFLAAALSVVIATPSFAADDQGGCASKFSASGGQYKSSVVLPEVSSQTAYKKAYTSLVKKGYQITQSDKDIGVITASQPAKGVLGMANGQFNVFNVLIESDSGAGSKIEFSFSVGGAWTSSDAVRDEFCKLTSEILGQPDASAKNVP
jgi:hypothetical protein